MVTNTTTSDVVVVGGGIHGCSTALHLARDGLSVVLLEKDHVARHASGVNAGGVRRLGRDVAEVALSVASHELWQDMPMLVGDDCGYRTSCYLKVARDDAEMDAAQRRVDVLRQRGFNHESVVDQATLRELMPAVADEYVGALHVDGDGSAQPFQTTLAFARRALQLGVQIVEGQPVQGASLHGDVWRIDTPAGRYEAPLVVNASGAWGSELARLLGDEIPLAAHAPMLAITTRMAPFVEPVVGSLGEALSLKQMANGTVLIGGGVKGTAYPQDNRATVDMRGAATFLRTARRVFPVLADAVVNRLWSGIEGYTPDHLPVLSQGSQTGVVHSFGYSAHGFQLGPAAGLLVCQLLLNQSPVVDPSPFSYCREALQS
jgi:sarcosine oxidase subunit beta